MIEGSGDEDLFVCLLTWIARFLCAMCGCMYVYVEERSAVFSRWHSRIRIRIDTT